MPKRMARGGENPLPAPFPRRIRIFAIQGARHLDATPASRKVLFMDCLDFHQVPAKRLLQRIGQHGDPVFCAFAVADGNFSRNEITVRDGKGAKDRVTMLPDSLKEPLRRHLVKVKAIHEKDLAAGWGRVQVPGALDRKYPNAPREWRWQWIFPASCHTFRHSFATH